MYIGSIWTNQTWFSKVHGSLYLARKFSFASWFCASVIHVCSPLQDRDGQATLIALGPISKGEEVIHLSNLGCCSFHSCNQFKVTWNGNPHLYIFVQELFNILEHFQVTISYVDEDLSFEERQALLADYGFKCTCPKCLLEETWSRHSQISILGFSLDTCTGNNINDTALSCQEDYSVIIHMKPYFCQED